MEVLEKEVQPEKKSSKRQEQIHEHEYFRKLNQFILLMQRKLS